MIRVSTFVLAGLLASCASFRVPDAPDEGPIRARAERGGDDGVRVAAALLTPEELDAVFGVDLASKGIEPVWMEFENLRDEPVFFLISGMDPEYFAPLEVGHLFRAKFAGERNERVSRHLSSLAIDYRSAIPPGATVSGFAYTNDIVGAKVLDLDFVGSEWSTSVTLFVADPAGSEGGVRVTRVRERYSPPELVQVDEAGLAEAIAGLPCCAEDKDGNPVAPLNLVMIGDLQQGLSAFQRRGYRFDATPSLYAFQRPADAAATKKAQWVSAQPQVVHMWQTPLRYDSRPLWLGQVSLPTGGRFGRGADGIDRFVDRARDTAVQDLLYSQHVAKLGRARGADCEGCEDGIETDGLRWVMILEERAVALDELSFFRWLEADPPR